MAVHYIRWQQRFANFTKALAQLNEADDLSKQRALSRLEKQGLFRALAATLQARLGTA